MAKTIIFCADGTWNGPGKADGDLKTERTTNVFRLFINLDGHDTEDTALLANEQERVLKDPDGNVLQWAKYLHGVGDSENILLRLLGGTAGAGLIARIVRGYTFISRNYRPGDRICIVGFSRGAYTARALAGLIVAKGLLDADRNELDNRDAAYRLGAAVWYAYRNVALRSKPGLLSRLEETLADLPHFLFMPPAEERLIEAPIEAVAVWDTVGALGIPIFTLQSERIDAFEFADRALSPKVRHGLHAVAVDERRADFPPTLWDADPRITQVLFPGSHSDVGGGYLVAESGLSDCSLVWMATELGRLGVAFLQQPKYVPSPLPGGPAHAPWLEVPWNVLLRGARSFPPGLRLSRSLVDRIGLGPVIGSPGMLPSPYNPENLPGYLLARAVATGIIVE